MAFTIRRASTQPLRRAARLLRAGGCVFDRASTVPLTARRGSAGYSGSEVVHTGDEEFAYRCGNTLVLKNRDSGHQVCAQAQVRAARTSS